MRTGKNAPTNAIHATTRQCRYNPVQYINNIPKYKIINLVLIHLSQEYVLIKYLPKDNITEPIDIIEPRSFGLDISAMYTLAEFVPTAKLKY